MKVVVDMDPRDVWLIQDRAERFGVTSGEVLRDVLAKDRNMLEQRRRIRLAVIEGKCDADIAAEMGLTNQTVSTIRRGFGLPANRRYGRKAS